MGTYPLKNLYHLRRREEGSPILILWTWKCFHFLGYNVILYKVSFLLLLLFTTLVSIDKKNLNQNYLMLLFKSDDHLFFAMGREWIFEYAILGRVSRLFSSVECCSYLPTTLALSVSGILKLQDIVCSTYLPTRKCSIYLLQKNQKVVSLNCSFDLLYNAWRDVLLVYHFIFPELHLTAKLEVYT